MTESMSLQHRPWAAAGNAGELGGPTSGLGMLGGRGSQGPAFRGNNEILHGECVKHLLIHRLNSRHAKKWERSGERTSLA